VSSGGGDAWCPRHLACLIGNGAHMVRSRRRCACHSGAGPGVKGTLVERRGLRRGGRASPKDRHIPWNALTACIPRVSVSVDSTRLVGSRRGAEVRPDCYVGAG